MHKRTVFAVCFHCLVSPDEGLLFETSRSVRCGRSLTFWISYRAVSIRELKASRLKATANGRVEFFCWNFHYISSLRIFILISKESPYVAVLTYHVPFPFIAL